MNTEKTEPTRDTARPLDAMQGEGSDIPSEKPGAKGAAFSAGDYVRTSPSALIEGIGRITGYADDDYEYPGRMGEQDAERPTGPDYLNFYIVYFGDDVGTCTVHVSDIVEKVTQKEYDAAMVEYAAEAAAHRQTREPSPDEARSGIAHFLAKWQETADAIDAPWREDIRYRQHKDGALFYKGGEQGQYIRVSNNGTITVGRFDLAKPGSEFSASQKTRFARRTLHPVPIEDAVLSAATSHHLPNYDQALMLAARLGGDGFAADLLGEAERLAVQVTERRQVAPVPAVAHGSPAALSAQTKAAEITTPYPYLAQLAQNLTAAADYVLEMAHADWPEGTEPARLGEVAVDVADLAAKFQLPFYGEDNLASMLINMLTDKPGSWFMRFEDGKFIYPVGKSAEELERAQAAEIAARVENAERSHKAQKLIVWQVSTESTPGHWREDERYRKADDGVMYYLGNADGQYMHIEGSGGLSVGRFRCNEVNGATTGFAGSTLTLDVSQQFGGYEHALSMAANLGGARFEADILGEAALLSAAIVERREKLRVAALEESAEAAATPSKDVTEKSATGRADKTAPPAPKAPTERADGYTSVKDAIERGKSAPQKPRKAKGANSKDGERE